MRRIPVGTGTLVLVLATLMWATSPVSAYRGGGGGGGGRAGGFAGGGRGVAHVGSVHYGARAARDPAGPAVRPGVGRSGNFAGAASRAPIAIPTATRISGASVRDTGPS